MGKKMKIDKLRGKLILKNPKIIDPLNETIFQNDVMLDNNKIVEIGSIVPALFINISIFPFSLIIFLMLSCNSFSPCSNNITWL